MDCPECDGFGTITHPEWKAWFEARVLAGRLTHENEILLGGATRIVRFADFERFMEN